MTYLPSRIIFKVNGKTLYDNDYNSPQVEVTTTTENELMRNQIRLLPDDIASVTYTIEVTEL